MYGVVVCPRCKRAKGVDLKQKNTTCPCGFTIRVIPAKAKARAVTPRELAPLVARANAELGGGLKIVDHDMAPTKRPRIRDVHARIVAAVPERGDRATRIRAAALELTKELQIFTLEDWSRVLAGLGIPEPEAALEALIRNNAVFQPKEGYYRIVGINP
jgi:hypothetical protein